MTVLDSVDVLAAVAARVRDDLPSIVARMGEAYRAEIPDYAEMPAADFDDVLETSRRLAAGFLESVISGLPAVLAGEAALAAAGERRLEMGVPLDSALHAFRIGGRVVWDATVEAAAEHELRALPELGGRWIDYVDRASSAFARGYLSASHEHLRRLDAQRRAIVEALLDAADAGDIAAIASRWSLTVARTYTPVLVAGGDVPALVGRLLELAPGDSLASERGERVLLLVPGPDAGAVASIEGAVTVVGRSVPPGRTLLAEVHALETVADAAVAAGRTSGRFTPDDLLLEQSLAAAPRVRDSLVRRVAGPLAEQDPDGIFRSTLRVYLATGSAPETARREHVHVNTVAYRLKRVREITGLDPRVPHDATILVLALTAAGATSGSASGDPA